MTKNSQFLHISAYYSRSKPFCREPVPEVKPVSGILVRYTSPVRSGPVRYDFKFSQYTGLVYTGLYRLYWLYLPYWSYWSYRSVLVCTGHTGFIKKFLCFAYRFSWLLTVWIFPACNFFLFCCLFCPVELIKWTKNRRKSQEKAGKPR